MQRSFVAIVMSLGSLGLAGCVWTGPTEDHAEKTAIHEKPQHDPQPGAEGPTGPTYNGYSSISNANTPTTDPNAQKQFDAPKTSAPMTTGPSITSPRSPVQTAPTQTTAPATEPATLPAQ